MGILPAALGISLECADRSALWLGATCRAGESGVMPPQSKQPKATGAFRDGLEHLKLNHSGEKRRGAHAPRVS